MDGSVHDAAEYIHAGDNHGANPVLAGELVECTQEIRSQEELPEAEVDNQNANPFGAPENASGQDQLAVLYCPHGDAAQHITETENE